MSQLQKSKLQEIWEGIITKGGSTLTIDPTAPVPVDTTREYPPVSVVELIDEEPIQFDDPQLIGDILQNPLVLSEEKVGFLPDQAIFSDSELAMETPVSYTHLDVYKRQASLILSLGFSANH